MSDIEEDYEEYNEEDEVEFESDIEKIEETQLTEKVNEEEDDEEEDEEEEEEVEAEEIDEENEDLENMLFNEKAKIKEEIYVENVDDDSKRVIEHKIKRLYEIKYYEFIALYSYRYGTLCRGGNALTEPVKDDIDETIFKEILEGKSPMYIQKNNIYIPLKPDKSIKFYIDNIRVLLNL